MRTDLAGRRAASLLLHGEMPLEGSAGRRARGAFVVVVGPDGAGKTSVARALIELDGGPTAYFHFLPRIRTPLAERPPDRELPPPHKGAPHGSRVLGVLRLARNFVRVWVAHLYRVRPALRRGCLVIGDRWAYGYVAQPHALRFYGPAWLASAAIRSLPRPDLVVNLSAAPEIIRARKQELTVSQIEIELRTWASLPAAHLETIVATDPPGAIARRILEELAS